MEIKKVIIKSLAVKVVVKNVVINVKKPKKNHHEVKVNMVKVTVAVVEL